MNAAVCKTVVLARCDPGAQLHFTNQHGGYGVIAAFDAVHVAEPERNRLASPPFFAAVPGSEAADYFIITETPNLGSIPLETATIEDNRSCHSSNNQDAAFQHGSAEAATFFTRPTPRRRARAPWSPPRKSGSRRPARMLPTMRMRSPKPRNAWRELLASVSRDTLRCCASCAVSSRRP